ncbi:hypothetical protein B0H13DRAFT_1948487, partial [Mycena leptocephala]
PQSSIPARTEEPVPQPRPKKRKNPPASQDPLPTSDSSLVFKVPALPQRLTLDSASTPVSSAPTSTPTASKKIKKSAAKPVPSAVPSNAHIPPSSTSAPVSSAPTSTPTAAPASQTKKKAASKLTPSTSNAGPPDATPTPATKKRKTIPTNNSNSIASPARVATHPNVLSSASDAVPPDATIPPSATNAPKKRKTVPTNNSNSIASPAHAATHPNVVSSASDIPPSVTNAPKKRKAAPTNSIPSATNQVTDPTQSITTISAADPWPKVSKRPSALAPINPPPPKKQKFASLLPVSKPPVLFKTLLPKTAATPIHSSAVPPNVIRLPTVKPKRFVPLIVRTKKPSVPVPAAAPPAISMIVSIDAQVSGTETLYHLDLPTSPPPPSLTTITLPPKLTKRKYVPRFALLLSSVADEDLRNCVLVSRMFRYSGCRLVRHFAGKRLSMVLAKTQELSTRKREYGSSFLSRLFPGGANSPISERLWTSPDHERQIIPPYRLFFQVSGWNEGQIVDAQELVKDEVWTITVRHSATSTESFYVLEPTCEPLTTSLSTGVPVRTDWSAYIAHRALPSSVHNSPAPRLLDYLRWTNHEEYQLGISRLWLKRVEVKRVVAERYIFACVVANSLSGRYMSSTQMAQEFAGLPDVPPARVKAIQKHHHVESVHFTTSGRALHNALAIVQTPGRIYYILRDNGMQVGCEEEGVAEVWMNVLGCDNSGVTSRIRPT